MRQDDSGSLDLEEVKQALRLFLENHPAPLSGVKLRRALLATSDGQKQERKPEPLRRSESKEGASAKRKFGRRLLNKGKLKSDVMRMSASLDKAQQDADGANETHIARKQAGEGQMQAYLQADRANVKRLYNEDSQEIDHM